MTKPTVSQIMECSSRKEVQVLYTETSLSKPFDRIKKHTNLTSFDSVTQAKEEIAYHNEEIDWFEKEIITLKRNQTKNQKQVKSWEQSLTKEPKQSKRSYRLKQDIATGESHHDMYLSYISGYTHKLKDSERAIRDAENWIKRNKA